ERVPHFPRRRERPRVEAIVPDLSRAPDQAIDGAREPNRHAPQPARERTLVVPLHEQMDVVLLHGIVHDAKPRSRRPSQRSANLVEHELFAKARQPSRRPQRHMDRMGLLVVGTSAMGDALSKSRRFSPRARAPPPANSKLELLLSPPLHV